MEIRENPEKNGEQWRISTRWSSLEMGGDWDGGRGGNSSSRGGASRTKTDININIPPSPLQRKRKLDHQR